MQAKMVNRGPHAEGAGEGVRLSIDSDREHRTKVHRAIAEALPYLQTRTGGDPGHGSEQRVIVSWSKRRGGGKRKRQGSLGNDVLGRVHGEGGRGRGGRASQNRGEPGRGTTYVRFALRKEGREHNRAATALCKVLHVPLSALSFGGIKDKMAVSTQACVLKGVTPHRILSSNGRVAGITVGNVSFCDRHLSLGEQSGNRFSIVIRGVSVPGAVVENSLREASASGFVNFFGTQRVGSPLAAAQGRPLPYQVGRDILSGDWEAAVRKILQPRDTDPAFLLSALTELREGKITPKQCLARVKGNNRLSHEKLVLQTLIRSGDSAFKTAIQRVPYGMRTMWVHAYQSHVWNTLASARIRLLGPRAVPGDLILPADSSCGATEGLLPFSDENSSEFGGGNGGDDQKDIGGRDKDGVAGLAAAQGSVVSEMGEGIDSSRSGAKGAVDVLTVSALEAFASEGVTPEDLLRRVVLPLPGTTVGYPSHKIGTMYKKRLEQDGVDTLMYPKFRPCTGGLAASAGGVDDAIDATGAAVDDSGAPRSPTARLQGTLAAGASPGPSDSANSGSCRGPAVASSLVPKGANRRLLCVPADVSWKEARSWTDAQDYQARETSSSAGDTHPLTNGERCGPVGGTAPGESGGCGDSAGAGGRVSDGSRAAVREIQNVSLTFSLPPGSFATMFLREVMKSNEDIAWGGGRQEGDGQGLNDQGSHQ